MYEMLYRLEKTGIDIRYCKKRGQYTPPHWHSAVELIYVLDGTGSVVLDEKEHFLKAGDLLVIDSDQIHEVKCAQVSMMIILQYSREKMKTYVKNIDRFRLCCSRESLEEAKEKEYRSVCALLRQLPLLYVEKPLGYELKSQAVAMEILFELLNHFAEENTKRRIEKETALKRLGEAVEYIDEHHQEPISPEKIAAHFSLKPDYFNRFFRKNMGLSLLKYITKVRLVHIYYDIYNTEDDIMDIMEKHGFKSYKMLIKMFREIYGCKPQDLKSNIK